MRPDEPHIHEPDREFDYGDQAEIVSFDIEHITLVAYIINGLVYLIQYDALHIQYYKKYIDEFHLFFLF